MRLSHIHRSAFTLVELLVVAAIMGVLIGMLLPAIALVQEAVSRVNCENHLRQVGLAIHQFHDSNGGFPLDQEVVTKSTSTIPPQFPTNYLDMPQHMGLRTVPSGTYLGNGLGAGFIERSNLFIDVAPYFGYMNSNNKALIDSMLGTGNPITKHANEFIVAGQGGRETEIEKFLSCPSRRSDTGEYYTTPGFLDFASGMHPTCFTNGAFSPVHPSTYPTQVQWTTASTGPGWAGKRSILGGIYQDRVRLQDICDRDGTANTMLLAHKGVEPTIYEDDGRMGGFYKLDEAWWDLGFDDGGGPFEIDDEFRSEGLFTGGVPAKYKFAYWLHKRYPGYFGRDHVKPPANLGNIPVTQNFLLTSPHKNMPVLYGDGSLRSVAFTLGVEELGYMWSYNDGVNGSAD